MKAIRIGLAGLGHRGLHWLRVMKRLPELRVVALYDWIEPLHAAGRAEVADGDSVRCYSDYARFLADPEIDAVALCVRQPDQGALAAQALEAGKHVNSEVPAAQRLEDCWRLVLAAERSGKVYHLAEQVRYAGFVEAWRELVAQGKLGDITYAEGQYLGYYGTSPFFRDFTTGRAVSIEELPNFPGAKPTWLHEGPPIHYLPHELSPLLKILDDRVVEVVAMSSPTPSRAHPQIKQADVQVALMRTAKGTVLRLLTGFAQPGPKDDHHWYQLVGSRGRVEWRRRPSDKPRGWFAGHEDQEMFEADWTFERREAAAAGGSGHWDLDYYAQAALRDAVLYGKPPELDVYRAVETAAPAILAAESIARGGVPLAVPDFRPSTARPKGAAPAS